MKKSKGVILFFLLLIMQTALAKGTTITCPDISQVGKLTNGRVGVFTIQLGTVSAILQPIIYVDASCYQNAENPLFWHIQCSFQGMPNSIKIQGPAYGVFETRFEATDERSLCQCSFSPTNASCDVFTRNNQDLP